MDRVEVLRNYWNGEDSLCLGKKCRVNIRISIIHRFNEVNLRGVMKYDL